MTNEITAFNFGAQEVRTVLIDNEPWFVGKDVADALGYSNTRDALSKHVDEDDKLVSHITTSGQGRAMTTVNESGMYSLVFGSKLESAKQFKKWVTSEVLPAIRKHGAYMTDQKIEEALTDPDTIIRLATDLKKERQAKKALQKENSVLLEQNNEMKPKVEFAEKVQQSEATISVSALAKLLSKNGNKIGRNTLFDSLRSLGWLLANNEPSQRGINQGLFTSHEALISTGYGKALVLVADVTPKGQEYFLEKWTKQTTEEA